MDHVAKTINALLGFIYRKNTAAEVHIIANFCKVTRIFGNVFVICKSV